MRLRKSVLTGPGIARVRRGKGFSYEGPDGEPLGDPKALARIKELVIPPAWKQVWISPHANGRPSSYVDPRVVTGYERGQTIASAAKRAARAKNTVERQAILEKATRTLIQRVGKS